MSTQLATVMKIKMYRHIHKDVFRQFNLRVSSSARLNLSTIWPKQKSFKVLSKKISYRIATIHNIRKIGTFKHIAIRNTGTIGNKYLPAIGSCTWQLIIRSVLLYQFIAFRNQLEKHKICYFLLLQRQPIYSYMYITYYANIAQKTQTLFHN